MTTTQYTAIASVRRVLKRYALHHSAQAKSHKLYERRIASKAAARAYKKAAELVGKL